MSPDRVCRRRAMLGRPGGAADNPNVADAIAGRNTGASTEAIARSDDRRRMDAAAHVGEGAARLHP